MPKTDEALLLSACEAAKTIGISRSLLYELHAEGKLPAPVKLGRRVLWRKIEIQEWINAGCPDRLTWEQQRSD